MVSVLFFLFTLLCLTVPLFQHRIKFHVLLLASVSVFITAFSSGGDGGKTKLKGVLIVYFRTKYLFFSVYKCVSSAIACFVLRMCSLLFTHSKLFKH